MLSKKYDRNLRIKTGGDMLLPGCFLVDNNGSGCFFIFLCLRHGSLCLTGILTVPFFWDKGHKGAFTKNSADNKINHNIFV